MLKLLGSDRTKVITTLLQNFDAAVNVLGTAFDSTDIFVLVYEGTLGAAFAGFSDPRPAKARREIVGRSDLLGKR